MDLPKIEHAVREILEAIGEDPDREGLQETPQRVARMYAEVFAGLHRDISKDIKTFHGEGNDEMILIGDIPFYSMCEHHLLPFHGKAHVVYIPRGGKTVTSAMRGGCRSDIRTRNEALALINRQRSV